MPYNIGIPEGEESEEGIESLLEETMTKNFPHMGRKKKHKFRKLIKSQISWTKRGTS